MDKTKMRETLEHAVRETHKRYPNFQGVIPFGSFFTDKENPTDIDLIPVLKKYCGDWRFRPVWEDMPEFDEDYYVYEDVESYFASYFADFAEGYNVIVKKGKTNGLIHIESLVALDNIPLLKMYVILYSAKPKEFIGTEEAARIIKGFYRKSDSE